MKLLTWFISFLIAAIVDTIIKDLGIAYSLAVLIYPDDIDRMALLAGAFSGLFSATTYFLAYYFAKKKNEKREIIKFQREVVKSGLSAFEYAKSITPMKVITYCDQHLDAPVNEITAKLEQLPDSKVISRPCADALIEGYTKLIKQRQAHPDILNNPDIKVNWRD